MLRGIITGFFFGGVLGLMVAGVASLLYPLPSTITTETTVADASAQPEAPTGQGIENASATDAPVNADANAQSPAPVDGADAAPNADQASAPKPSPATIDQTQAAPAAEGNLDVAVDDVSPVFPNPQARPITEPGTDDEPSISVDPAQPQSPDAPDATAFTTPERTEEPVASDSETPAEQPNVQDTAEAPSQPAVNSFQTSSTDLTAREDTRVSNRLPSVDGADETASEITEDTQAAGALARNAQQVALDESKPLISVILMDDPSASVDLATLANFPMPISVAVNALSSDASERAAAYRALGLEVFAIVDLPEGASPSDVEINVASQLSVVPEAVGVLEGLAGGLQENRSVSEQVIASLLETGHGLLMQPKGLNTAQKLAAREGVPSLTIFRDFDNAGQTEVVMRRFLDQAAFKAGQTNGVVMLGRVAPTTIAALASWALQDRASTVSIAPVSATLMAQ